MNDAVIGPGTHASRESSRVQAEVIGEAFESFDTSTALALVYVQMVVVGPECFLFSCTFGGQGRLVGIFIDVRKVQIGVVYKAGVYVGLLYLEGRSTGPMPAAGSHEVAEIGDGDGGVRITQDVPVPGRGRCGGSGVGGRGVGGIGSGWRHQGVRGERFGGSRRVNGLGGGRTSPREDGKGSYREKKEAESGEGGHLRRPVSQP